ncbi:type II secretion system F family protein [Variovorax fucosicus]|uniref:type II secretion system F family protein n=1 Tax=Variovorax fucosicus TaxID=3053517 RepID=UPI002576CF14|nr:type II secretion system F family protein [Variovorax sp. J22G47]MDM0057538.1 type II secretion system F family protein [Variovorax sp. J22G47]
MLLFPALVFLTVMLGFAGLFIWLAPTRTGQRLQAMSDTPRKSQWTETAVKIVGPFAQLSSPTGDAGTSPLRVRFLNAGIRLDDAQLIYFGAKTLLPLVFAGAAALGLRATGQAVDLTLVFYLVVAALIGCYLPNFFLAWKIRNRKREIFENFPDAADLMLVCVEAGLGLDAGLVKVTEEIRMKSQALAQELHWTNLEMRAGAAREKSLRNLALRTGVEEIGTFATMLTQADKFGTSIGESLRVFSDDLRHKRQMRAEELAAKVPTKMLLPLVICVFPSIIMVVLGPAVIQIIRTMLPMLTGRG